MSDKKTKHYVNNADFLAALIEYKRVCDEAKKNNKAEPSIPNYIGECFLKIAEHLSRKPNFVSYSFRDEMIADGIENCIQYFRNFDETKSKNPFAYFTQIIYFAFLRRIQKEKKQQHVKHKIIENMNVDILMDSDGDQSVFVDYLQKNFLPDEAVYKPKKKKPQPKGLELFYNEDGEEINEDRTDY